MKVLLVANTGYNFYQFRLPVIRMLRAAGVELTLACPAGPFAERLKSEGIRVIEWEMRRRSLNPVRVVVSLLRLITIYRRERPNLVHHITIQANIYGSLAALVAGTGMVVNSWTGLGFVFSAARSAALMRAVLLPFMWLSMRRRRVWSIFLNEHDQERGLRMRFAHPNRVVIIPGEGVDTERFSPPLQRPQNERPKVLMIARLLWDKGIAEFREAAHMLNARGVAAEFLLAGDGTKPTHRPFQPNG